MFDIASSEVVILGVVALLVIPPKDLPKAMRMAGHWIGKVRGVANQFRSGFDTMVREAELQEMEKKWAAENERIMREHPPEPAPEPTMLPTPGHGVGYDGTEGAVSAGDAPPVMTAQPVTAPAIAPAPAAEPEAHPS